MLALYHGAPEPVFKSIAPDAVPILTHGDQVQTEECREIDFPLIFRNARKNMVMTEFPAYWNERVLDPQVVVFAAKAHMDISILLKDGRMVVRFTGIL
jgi:hypothetical protein